MIVIFNGAGRDVDPDTSVSKLLAVLQPDLPVAGIAVAVNDDVIPRSEWETRKLAAHDRVQVVTAVQGG